MARSEPRYIPLSILDEDEEEWEGQHLSDISEADMRLLQKLVKKYGYPLIESAIAPEKSAGRPNNDAEDFAFAYSLVLKAREFKKHGQHMKRAINYVYKHQRDPRDQNTSPSEFEARAERRLKKARKVWRSIFGVEMPETKPTPLSRSKTRR